MNKGLALLILITMTTSAFAANIQKFIGTYSLDNGDDSCKETLSIQFIEDTQCLFVKTSGAETYSRTDKICNFNQPTSINVENIPAPIHMGTITNSTATVTGPNMIMPEDSIYHFSMELVQYTTGLKEQNSHEINLNLADEETLFYSYKFTKTGNYGVELKNENCEYRMN